MISPTRFPFIRWRWVVPFAALAVCGTWGAGRTAEQSLDTAGNGHRYDRQEAGKLDDGRFAEYHLTRALVEALSPVSLDGNAVVIAPMMGQNPQPLVRRSILRAALAGGARVYANARVGKGDAPRFVVRYGVADLRVDVAREGFSFPWRGRYRRRLRADILVEVISPKNEIVWAHPVSVNATDIIPRDNYKSSANPAIIKRYEMPRRHYLLEGFAVAAVVASFLLLAH